MERQELITEEEKNILISQKEKRSFLEKITDETEQMILGELVKKKEQIRREKKKDAEAVNETVKNVLDGTVVEFSDGTNLTLRDKIVAGMLSEFAQQEHKDPIKDLLNLNKLEKGETSDGTRIQIVFESNGQDLGD